MYNLCNLFDIELTSMPTRVMQYETVIDAIIIITFMSNKYLVLGCEDIISASRVIVTYWSEHWNGIQRTWVRVTVEVHVFQINSSVIQKTFYMKT